MSKQVETRKRKKQKYNSESSEEGTWLELKTNPLFVEVVLENVLKFLKGSRNALKLGKYRLVCKFWDNEITKLLRRDTYINLKILLLPYPEGMGWTEIKQDSAAFKKRRRFHYKIPYPEVRAFENIKLTLKANEELPFENSTFGVWFKRMGSQVKSVSFQSTLSTIVKKRYKVLESILTEWCPNLESLTLDGVRHFDSLIFESRFTETTNRIVCKGLKEVKIVLNSNHNYKWRKPKKMPTIVTKCCAFNEFIYKFGLPGSTSEFPEYRNHSRMKVEIPSELFKKSEFPNISQFIPENFFPRRFDNGILGQLISCTSVEKFSLVGRTIPKNIRHLAALFHYRNNSWRSSLKYLELNLVHGKSISRELVVFGKLGCPIATLIFKQGFDRQHPDVTIQNITRFIACFAETLQYLEYAGTFRRLHGSSSKFMLPVLPKLKTFVYRNSCDTELCPITIMTSLTNLKTLLLTSKSNSGSTTETSFFETKTGNLTNDLLMNIKITGRLSGMQGCQFLKWFPNVKRVEVSIQDMDDGISAFIRQLGNMDVEHLRMTWSRTKGNVKGTRSNTALICQVNQLKTLKSLVMRFDHMTYPFCVMLTAFTEGFGLLTQLRILKLTNFGVYRNDYPDIEKCIAYIPVKQFVNMSYHCSSSSTKPTRKDIVPVKDNEVSDPTL